MKNRNKTRITLRQRFRYWLDRRMAQGTSSMVKLLVATADRNVLRVGTFNGETGRNLLVNFVRESDADLKNVAGEGRKIARAEDL